VWGGGGVGVGVWGGVGGVVVLAPTPKPPNPKPPIPNPQSPSKRGIIKNLI